MSFSAYTIRDTRPAVALVTGAKTGIGRAIALKIAEFPFIERVFCVSRSIQDTDNVITQNPQKMVAVPADIGTPEGRQTIIDQVQESGKQLRFLVHSAGTIDPIKSPLAVTAEELRNAMSINCEAPFLLTTSLYDSMCGDDGIAGRVLHVSSGAAHGAPPVGWSVYGITKAAFFQSYKVLEREFRHAGGRVVVGSFKPGVVDTAMQGTIRQAPAEAMPIVGNFQGMKDRVVTMKANKAVPPPKGALDSPDNVAFFAEYLLLGTTDEEFGNKDEPNEYDIRNKELYPKWIPAENLPKED